MLPNETLRQVKISAILALSSVVFGPLGFSPRREGRYLMMGNVAMEELTRAIL
jgi:hypothetical protein